MNVERLLLRSSFDGSAPDELDALDELIRLAEALELMPEDEIARWRRRIERAADPAAATPTLEAGRRDAIERVADQSSRAGHRLAELGVFDEDEGEGDVAARAAAVHVLAGGSQALGPLTLLYATITATGVELIFTDPPDEPARGTEPFADLRARVRLADDLGTTYTPGGTDFPPLTLRWTPAPPAGATELRVGDGSQAMTVVVR